MRIDLTVREFLEMGFDHLAGQFAEFVVIVGMNAIGLRCHERDPAERRTSEPSSQPFTSTGHHTQRAVENGRPQESSRCQISKRLLDHMQAPVKDVLASGEQGRNVDENE